jgi:hypothetical protein
MKPMVSRKTNLISSVKSGKRKVIRVEVRITPSKKEVIVMQYGDNISKVAESFCKEHSLDIYTKNKLIDILHKHTSELTDFTC